MGTARATTDLTELDSAQTEPVSGGPDSASVQAAGAGDSASAPPRPESVATSWVAFGHEALFGDVDAGNRCDVCGAVVEEDDGEGADVPGRALYVWARGDELRREEPPLCSSCAAALGLSALGRWEIEEEEG
jgi:hypothetical protein